jgi:hypothetical protein
MSALAISEDVKFDCNKIQLKYDIQDGKAAGDEEYVNRYAVIRKDTGKLLGIHSDEYIVRPYYELAEKVNEVIKQTINLDKYEIETVDRVHEGGKKYTRLVNFWSEGINTDNFSKLDKKERIIPQLRIYSSLDGQWGQQIMWSSVYVVCLNGMVRPDWTFTVYTKHNKKEDISFTLENFLDGMVAHKKLGEDLFKMMQKKIRNPEVSYLFRETLAKKPAKLDTNDASENIMRALNDLWERYSQRYGNTLFAVYQTATDWSSHPDTRGEIYNVSRKREKQVAQMLNSSEWLGLYE